MFGFSDEHKMVRQMVRKWVESKLQPKMPALDKNEILPYDLMRDFAATFGLADLARGAFERMKDRPSSDEERGASIGGGDPALQAILALELSRASSAFFMAFGASLGLAGGAIMSKGTLEQKRRW